jgi:hypothetical protein
MKKSAKFQVSSSRETSNTKDKFRAGTALDIWWLDTDFWRFSGAWMVLFGVV